MLTIEQQLETAQLFLDKYRAQAVPIDYQVTMWFESIIESLNRLKDLEK